LNDLLKIFSSIESKRQTFVFDLVFKQLLGIGYGIVSDEDSAHIVYSNFKQNSLSLNIPLCSDLLTSKGFEPIKVPFKNSGANTILFPSENNNGWNFDIFSAIFYLVSRYEEYKGFEPDAHKRFPPEASILHQTNSFEFPLVNSWVQKLKNELLTKFPELTFNEPKFKFISTIDVDSTFQYKEKGFLWSISGLVKDLVKGNFNDVKNRVKTLFGHKNDAFDVFNDLHKFHKNYNNDVIFFYLLGNYSPFDKNISWKNKKQQNLIKTLSKNYEIGIHPSYLSNSKEDLLQIEKTRLETIINKKVEISRQHFLVHQFPKTYQNLIKTGIKKDYTLGYTRQYGFRAGIASPFNFYDLEKEEITDLELYPFCTMDITPLHYFNLSIDEAINKNKTLLKRVKEVNGVFISLWHNESLSDTGRWQQGWSKVYKQLFEN